MARTEPQTREKILQAAEAEFLEKGYQGAWLRDIAKKAGVTTGALYGYFKNKEELFGALVSPAYHGIQEIYRRILAEFRTIDPSQQALHLEEFTILGMKEMVDYMYANYSAFKLILCCSQHTEYSDLVQQMALLDEQATHDFEADSSQAGKPMTPVHPKLEHILTSGLFTMFFELIVHDIPREEADGYTACLVRFFSAGYQKIMGY